MRAVPIGLPLQVLTRSPGETLPDWLARAQLLPEACPIEGAFLTPLPPLVGEGSCGVAPAVRLEAPAGGKPGLPSRPEISCGLAGLLSTFFRQDLREIARRMLDEDVTEVLTGPGYVCRHRNGNPDAKISEHAKGEALDVTGFVLSSGARVTVADDWGGESREAAFLKAVHSAACGHFTTVLGPEADADHADHFHLDRGCHGRDCTYRICQ